MIGLILLAGVCLAEKTPTGVRLVDDGRTVWEYVVDNPEGRPYVHPLTLADGSVATAVRPADHPWHLGLWFSWKFVNGLNFWEPSVKGGAEPEGMTRVTSRQVETKGAAAHVELTLDYAPRATPQETLLAERRTLDFSAPDARGGYEIRAQHVFTARRDVVLDRTPQRRLANGEVRGGYAGFGFRLADDLAASATAEVGSNAVFVCAGAAGGLRLEELQGTATSGAYLWGDRRFGSLSACRDGVVALKSGESLTLAYRVQVLPRRSPFLPLRSETGYPLRGDRMRSGYKDDLEKIGAIAASPRGACAVGRRVVETGIPGVEEMTTTVSNRTPHEVRLDRMHSLYVPRQLHGEKVLVETCHGEWAGEKEIVESELKRGTTLTIESTSGIRGAWESRAGFMLTVGTNEVVAGVLCWSGMWEIQFRRDVHDFLTIQGGPSTAMGSYVLPPGGELALPKAVIVRARSKAEATRKLHRWARTRCLPHGDRMRPVTFNSWEGVYFKVNEPGLLKMMDDFAALGGELFVVDDGWFGRGATARVNSAKGLGDWVVDPEKLSHGLAFLADEAQRRGLKFGLWVEPEMVNTNSELYAAHPDWVLREPDRPLGVGRGGSQAVLDLSRRDVQDHIVATLDRLVRETGKLAYLKWDANANLMDVPHANVPVDYVNGLYSVLRRFRAAHPEVDIQACASGGGRGDYGFLASADEFWASDNTDALDRVFIQWSALRYFPASTIAAHVTKTPNAITKRSLPLKFRFDVAMAGRLGLEMVPAKLTPEEFAYAKRRIAEYKRIRPIVQQGEFYPLVSPHDRDFAALMFVKDGRAVVFVWRVKGAGRTEAKLKLDGFDGREITVPLEGEYASEVLELAL